MTAPIDLLLILRAFGLETGRPVKAYRHVDHYIDGVKLEIEAILRHGEFDDFQARMGRGEFGPGLVASFVGEPRGLARFVGVWSVVRVVPGEALSRISKSRSFYKTLKNDTPWTELVRDTRFSALENRLVVRWPPGRLPHRWLISPRGKEIDVEVEEVRAHGFRRPFPGFSNIVLSHEDLEFFDRQGDGGAGWLEAMKSTRAVYLITDLESGNLYVGSATAEDGLWGRWRIYARSVHGNNKLMIEAATNIEHYADRLQFSVLETLGNLASRNDGLEAERRWKLKLGKKAVVLNAN